MKWVKRIGLIAVALIILVVVIVYFSVNSILRAEIQRQSSASLGVPTTLGAAKLSLLGGTLSLNDFDVASPPSFSAPNMLTLGGTSVAVHYGQLRGTPIHVSKIVIDSPVLVIQQSGMKLNLQSLMDQKSAPPQTSGGQPTEPMQVVIDELDVSGAQVEIEPGIPGLKDSYAVSIPALSLTNIGNSTNGVPIKTVVMQLATALAAKAGDSSNLPPQVKTLLSGGLGGITGQLGDEFKSQFQSLAGSIGGKSSGGGASQQIEQGLQGLLGNGAKK